MDDVRVGNVLGEDIQEGDMQGNAQGEMFMGRCPGEMICPEEMICTGEMICPGGEMLLSH